MGRRLIGAPWAIALVGALLLLVAPLAAGASPRAVTADPTSASISDSTLHWDQTATVRGSGFYPGAKVQVVLYPNAIILATTAAASDGSVTTTISGPHLPSRQYALGVQGETSAQQYGGSKVNITIIAPTPTISISSTKLNWGSQPVVSGVRWLSGTNVKVTLFPNNVEIGSIAVGGGGTFSGAVTIPSKLRSSTGYVIVVTGAGSDELFHLEEVQVTIVGNRPTISLSAKKAPRGSSLTVTGQLYSPGSKVLVTLVPGYEKLGTFSVGDDGSFSAKVTIPPRAAGNDPHGIVVTGTGIDSFYSYLLEYVNLGGSAPKGTITGTAKGIDEHTPPPPGVDLHPGGVTPGTLALGKGSSGNGVNASWLLVAIVVLLTAAAAAVIVLTARRDVRRNLRTRRIRLARRLGFRPPGT